MEGFSRINYSGVVFSRVDREDVRGPQQLKEHTLLYIRSGRAEVVCDGRRIPLAAGDCVFLRKDHRLVLDAWAPCSSAGSSCTPTTVPWAGRSSRWTPGGAASPS